MRGRRPGATAAAEPEVVSDQDLREQYATLLRQVTDPRRTVDDALDRMVAIRAVLAERQRAEQEALAAAWEPVAAEQEQRRREALAGQRHDKFRVRSAFVYDGHEYQRGDELDLPVRVGEALAHIGRASEV